MRKLLFKLDPINLTARYAIKLASGYNYDKYNSYLWTKIFHNKEKLKKIFSFPFCS